MSFMAVAYVPAFLEDRATFVKDRANGLYGALPLRAISSWESDARIAWLWLTLGDLLSS